MGICKKIIIFMIIAFTSFWIAGFVVFLDYIGKLPNNNSDSNATAIVVLTGGTNRVNAGFDLLEKGKAKYLLISGVGEKVSLEDLTKLWGKNPLSLPCCVTLGKYAQNTVENALEAKKYIKNNNITSFFLVTSHYHMPRALIEVKKIIPDSRIIPYAVIPEGYSFLNPEMMYLIFKEYNKFLFSYGRIFITKGF